MCRTVRMAHSRRGRHQAELTDGEADVPRISLAWPKARSGQEHILCNLSLRSRVYWVEADGLPMSRLRRGKQNAMLKAEFGRRNHESSDSLCRMVRLTRAVVAGGVGRVAPLSGGLAFVVAAPADRHHAGGSVRVCARIALSSSPRVRMAQA